MALLLVLLLSVASVSDRSGLVEDPQPTKAPPETLTWTIHDEEDPKLPGHVDILLIEIEYVEPILTSIWHLRDVPEYLVIDRFYEEPLLHDEYSWQLVISTDGNMRTGDAANCGGEYLLSLWYTPLADYEPSPVRFGEALLAGTYHWVSDPEAGDPRWIGSDRGRLGPATVEVDALADTLTISCAFEGVGEDATLCVWAAEFDGVAYSEDHIETPEAKSTAED